jgi:hypothetical protein
MINIDNIANLHDALIIADNKKPVSEFVTYIRENLATSTTSWKRIAGAFFEASEMYGSDSDLYKRLLKETGFHKSKASKFVAISSSERLKQYENQLCCVHSWNTLYEITTLSDLQFETLCIQFDLDNPEACPFLTEAQVGAFKREATVSSPFKRLAYITIDEDALKGQLLDGDLLETLHETLKALEDLSPFIKVEETGIDDAEASLFMQQVASTRHAIIKKKIKNICDRKLLSTAVRKLKGHTAEQHFQHVWGISRHELSEYVIEGAPEKAFSYLGVLDEYNEGKTWDAAMDEVQKRRVKFIERARARANTADPCVA